MPARHDRRDLVRVNRVLFRSLGVAALFVDRAGHVTGMNPEAERLTAWSEREALGRDGAELFRIRDEKDGNVNGDPLARVLDRSDIVCLAGDPILLARNGSEHNVSGSVWPLLDNRGYVDGAAAIFHDRTQATRDLHWLAFLHQASHTLSASLDYRATLAEVVRLAVDSVSDACAIALVEPDGIIRAIVGAHADAAQQPLVDELVGSVRLDPHAAEGTSRCIRERKPLVYLDVRGGYVEPGHRFILGSADPGYVRALQALGVHSFMCVPLIAAEKVLGAILWSSSYPWRFQPSDVERGQQLANLSALAIDNARLYREAQEALGVREDFLSVAAHELRTPLTALQLSLASLEKAQAAGNPEVVAKLARVATQANRLGELSESILDAMRLATGCIRLHVADVDLRKVVADAAGACREEAEQARCPIDLDSGPGVVIRCDKDRIEQAVGSLLSNAIKFGHGQPIRVTVDAADGMGRIMVTDRGIGVAPGDAARIFERFERAVPVQHYGGLGLGLYVAREIVRAHKGSIAVSSKPGVGATFRVLLPVGNGSSRG